MTKKIMKDMIQLQNANMYQEVVDNEKQDWLVRENITGTELASFPPNVSDEMMFKIIKFAREYELIAFNAGIQYGKTLIPTREAELEYIKEQLQESVIHSDKLADRLHELLQTEK